MDVKALNKIKARCEKAAPGPWKYYDNGFDGLIVGPHGEHIAGGEPAEGRLEDCPDTQFIIHSRTDVPELLAEVERLQKEYEEQDNAHHKLLMAYCEQKKRIATLKKALELAINDMNHIANGIANCKEFLSGGTDKVNALKLGRCDVCKGICHDDKPCHFEWRGIQQAQEQEAQQE